MFLCCAIGLCSLAIFQKPVLADENEASPVPATLEDRAILGSSVAQVPLVSQLSDVQPSDWAYQALVNLSRRYEGLTGYPNGTFQGNHTLSRDEFAAALVQVLDQIATLQLSISAEERVVLNRLQTEFSQEMAQLQLSLEDLELQSQLIAAQQVSTIVRFSGQLIVAATAGSYSGDQIIAPRGAVVTEDDPSSFFLNRVALFFDASFDGEDLLQIRLVSGSNGPNDNVAGSLEPNFGSTLDYAVQGRDNSFSLARAYYSFSPTTDLQVVLAPLVSISDFVDGNRSIPPSFRGFSTQALASNFVLLPRPFGTGAVLDWNPNGGDFSVRAAYVAADTSNTTGENTRLVGGGSTEDVQLFPSSGGSSDSGLFSDPYQGFVELEYASDRFAIRLQYAGGQVLGSDFDGVGVNAELAVSPEFALFGRYGASRYTNTTIGELTPQYWMAGATYTSLFKADDLTGIAVTQPFVEESVGNATQTTFEAFYNLPITERISVSPFTQVVINPANQDSNGTIAVGGLRTVFSF